MVSNDPIVKTVSTSNICLCTNEMSPLEECADSAELFDVKHKSSLQNLNCLVVDVQTIESAANNGYKINRHRKSEGCLRLCHSKNNAKNVVPNFTFYSFF